MDTKKLKCDLVAHAIIMASLALIALALALAMSGCAGVGGLVKTVSHATGVMKTAVGADIDHDGKPDVKLSIGQVRAFDDGDDLDVNGDGVADEVYEWEEFGATSKVVGGAIQVAADKAGDSTGLPIGEIVSYGGSLLGAALGAWLLHRRARRKREDAEWDTEYEAVNERAARAEKTVRVLSTAIDSVPVEAAKAVKEQVKIGILKSTDTGVCIENFKP